jgi:hypothetical protein
MEALKSVGYTKVDRLSDCRTDPAINWKNSGSVALPILGLLRIQATPIGIHAAKQITGMAKFRTDM